MSGRLQKDIADWKTQALEQDLLVRAQLQQCQILQESKTISEDLINRLEKIKMSEAVKNSAQAAGPGVIPPPTVEVSEASQDDDSNQIIDADSPITVEVLPGQNEETRDVTNSRGRASSYRHGPNRRGPNKRGNFRGLARGEHRDPWRRSGIDEFDFRSQFTHQSDLLKQTENLNLGKPQEREHLPHMRSNKHQSELPPHKGIKSLELKE